MGGQFVLNRLDLLVRAAMRHLVCRFIRGVIAQKTSCGDGRLNSLVGLLRGFHLAWSLLLAHVLKLLEVLVGVDAAMIKS